MASQKQINANRANGLKSTGPRTFEGKTRSSSNSLKHGLTAKTLVIGDEDPREFEELRAELMEHYDPQGPAERELVECIAGTLWRLRRFPMFEAAIFAARHAQVTEQTREEEARLRDIASSSQNASQEVGAEPRNETSDSKRLIEVGRTLIKDGVWNDALGKLGCHEARQLNSLRKTQIILEDMRAARPTKPGMLRALPISSAA